MPKTKIVCTIGPASSSPDTLRAMIDFTKEYGVYK